MEYQGFSKEMTTGESICVEVRVLPILYLGVPEWFKGTVCKTGDSWV